MEWVDGWTTESKTLPECTRAFAFPARSLVSLSLSLQTSHCTDKCLPEPNLHSDR